MKNTHVTEMFRKYNAKFFSEFYKGMKKRTISMLTCKFPIWRIEFAV